MGIHDIFIQSPTDGYIGFFPLFFLLQTLLSCVYGGAPIWLSVQVKFLEVELPGQWICAF